MLQVTHKRLYQIAGAIWLMIGLLLLRKGVQYLQWDGEYSTLLLLVLCALSLGILKGRMVLAKVALRTQKRLALLEEPTPITHLYTRGNALLILSMMGLGMLLNVLNIHSDIRAFIDIAVGSALIQGSISYFRLPRNA